MGNAQIFTAEDFDEEVLRSPIPVLVDFTAVWCPPCQRLAPIIEDLAGEYRGKVKVGKVDIDQCQEIANRFGIQSVPTVMLFKDGVPQDTMVGLNSKNLFQSKLDQLTGEVS